MLRDHLPSHLRARQGRAAQGTRQGATQGTRGQTAQKRRSVPPAALPRADGHDQRTGRRRRRPGDYVAAGLRRHWSPEQISRRMLLDFPDNEGIRACYETIYQAIYVQGRGELRKGRAKALRKGRAARRPRNDGQCRRPRFREPMVMISERAADVADRVVPGHWECLCSIRDCGFEVVQKYWTL